MLDLFTIFTKGGLVLWCFQDAMANLVGNPIDVLVQDVIVEGRASNESYSVGKYRAQYRLNNEFDLVFAAIYNPKLEAELAYVQNLLDAVAEEFTSKYAEKLSDPLHSSFDFEPEFKDLRQQALEDYRDESKLMRTYEETDKAMAQGSDLVTESSSSGIISSFISKPTEEEKDIKAKQKLEAMKRRRLGGAKDKRKPRRKSSSTPSTPQKIDYSEGKPPNERETEFTAEAIQQLRIDAQAESDSEEEDEIDTSESSKSGGLFSYFKTLTGAGTITEESLAPVMDKMRMHLISKNVAADIAAQLCESVKDALVGQTKGSFEGLSTVVKTQLDRAMTQILTPKRRVDVLRDIQAANSQGRPFSMVFCGVNGVGKSTNLSKIAYWLLKNNLRVMIAACDTFRAGAVEQLKTHVKKLSAIFQEEGQPPCIGLFDQGYNKDDADVAQAAIHFANNEGYDVVLVDTAGRMQDNDNLMRSLAKLIRQNAPDLVLFVGEALVGNEAVDQLTKFNQALIDLADHRNPRSIDGIVLTKFDTVDDKVGSSISMTYTTGKPIVFVGTGQTYGDLKKLNIKSVVTQLLKPTQA